MNEQLQPSPLLRWLVAAISFASAAIQLSKGFLRFEWVGWLCFGLYFLVGFPQRNSAKQRFGRTRSIATIVLLIVVVVAFGRDLYFLWRS